MTGDEMADRLLKGIAYEREQAKVGERARIAAVLRRRAQKLADAIQVPAGMPYPDFYETMWESCRSDRAMADWIEAGALDAEPKPANAP